MTDTALPAEAKTTLHVSGNSLPQLFENVAHQLLDVLIDPNDVGEAIREKIVLEAADTSALLVEWINTLLRLTSSQHIVFKKYRFQEFEAERKGPGRLRAEITGELVDPQRHIFRMDPASVRCEQVQLINDSKSIAAEVFLASRKIKLA